MSTVRWLIIFAGISCFSYAQQAEAKIAQDSIIERMAAERIRINQEKYNRQYFTIQLFNGGHQQAQQIQEEANRLFPDIPTFFTFETPNYKVQLGRFKFRSKAIQQLNSIRKEFPESFLIEQQ
ncbi:MAG: hypothetical protein ACON42_02490 [Flavobacteriaceae bacterium]